MKIKKIIIILIVILGLILISGCTNNPTNQTVSSGYFENQIVKFELPAGITATDTSNDTAFDIILYKNGISIGEIDSEVNPQQAIDAIEGYNTTFSGKNAVESNDEFGSQLYIKISNDTQGNSVGIRISLDPGYSKDYEVIKNSFVIKKAL